MQPNKAKPVALAGAHGNRQTEKLGSLKSPEYALDALRTQYLAEVFALSPTTAATVAELAFGGAS